MKLTAAMLTGILLFSTSVYADVNNRVQGSWGYTGTSSPSNWAHLDPTYALCGSGLQQSPISIPASAFISHQNTLKIDFTNLPLHIVNNGHTLAVLNDNSVSVKGIVLDGRDYHLRQFHFHTPSENELEGKNFPGEIHFVTQNAQDKLLVVAVFLTVGPKVNTGLQQILDHLPKTLNQEDKDDNISLNIHLLLPKNSPYYRFTGSLTTPPCTEGVTWIALKNPIYVTSAQIRALQQAMGGNNARPIQPLHGRTVLEVN